jgi:hypothetical protein
MRNEAGTEDQNPSQSAAPMEYPLVTGFLTEAQKDRFMQAAQQGVSVDVMTMFVDALVDTVLPEGAQRDAFALTYRERVDVVLGEIASEIRRAQLMQGVTPLPVKGQ